MRHVAVLKRDSIRSWVFFIMLAVLLLSALASGVASAQEGGSLTPAYRAFPIAGIGSRTVVWFVAQLHLTLAAFVLGVPMFAVAIEIVGHLSNNQRYDKLARDFIRLSLMVYSVTALFGGMLSFALIILYPKIWNYLVQIFSPTMYFYAVLLLMETFVLYVYYYSWDFLQERGAGVATYQKLGRGAGWMFIIACTAFIVGIVFFSRFLIAGIIVPLAATPVTSLALAFGIGLLLVVLCVMASKKVFHLCLGTLLNFLGTLLMVTANLWLTFMKSPGHAAYNAAGEKITAWAINTETGELVNFVTAILNETWQPVNIHRFIANVCVGGIIAAAYAAFRFLSARTEEERAYYDWMGYTGNFVAMIALIPLPFAGYYLGREVYAWNEQMGVNMMGGHFSWFFIMQAILIGIMFFGANYYLWLGLERIPGGRRYMKFIGWMEFLLVISFLIWITPHNPVATRAEIAEIGGPFHPLLAPFGVMAFKLTVINIIILTTFLSFLFYRRANKEAPVELTFPGKIAQALVTAALLVVVPLVGFFDFTDGSWQVADVGKTMDFLNALLLKYLLFAAVIGGFVMNFLLWRRARGQTEGRFVGVTGLTCQRLLMAFTFGLTLWLGYHGYLSDDATRLNDSIWQVVWVLVCMVLVTITDAFLLLPARSLGEIRWGRMPARSQYVLVMIAAAFVLTMSLMGTVRSGLRGPWHVFGYMKDTSVEAFHPSLAFSATMWGITVFIFFLVIAFIFWLGSMGEEKSVPEMGGAVEVAGAAGALGEPGRAGGSGNPGSSSP